MQSSPMEKSSRTTLYYNDSAHDLVRTIAVQGLLTSVQHQKHVISNCAFIQQHSQACSNGPIVHRFNCAVCAFELAMPRPFNRVTQ